MRGSVYVPSSLHEDPLPYLQANSGCVCLLCHDTWAHGSDGQPSSASPAAAASAAGVVVEGTPFAAGSLLAHKVSAARKEHSWAVLRQET